jgi:hypothetical protein
VSAAPDNAVVRVSRAIHRVVAAFAAVGLSGVAFLPQEHLHIAQGGEDAHHVEAVHRHFAQHQGTHGGPDIDHPEDGETQWLDARFVTPDPTSAHRSPEIVLHPVQPQPAPRQLSQHLVADVFSSVHDPPWAIAHPFRAPPALV